MPSTRAQKHTDSASSHISIIEYGESDDGQQFVRLQFDNGKADRSEFLRIDNLSSRMTEAFTELNKKGASLYDLKSQRDLLARIQDGAISATEKVRVATRCGYNGNAYILPNGEVIKGHDCQDINVCLTGIPSDLSERYHTVGEGEAWNEFVELVRKNSRLVFAIGLSAAAALPRSCGNNPVVAQMVAKTGGNGLSTILAAASGFWAWNPVDSVAMEYGGGDAWTTTLSGMEPLLAAYNDACVYLNETRLLPNLNSPAGAQLYVDAVMKLAGGIGKRRYDRTELNAWNVSGLSSSNLSLSHIFKLAGETGSVSSYVDRMLDIPPPAGGNGMFEDIGPLPNRGKFCAHLKKLAAEFRGWPAREFIHAMLWYDSKGKAASYFEKRCQAYIDAAKQEVVAQSGRDLARTHQKFGRVAGACSLLGKAKLWSLTEDEIFDAVLKCERDHVRYVDREAARFGLALDAEPEMEFAGPVASPRERLVEYIEANRSSFLDPRACDDDDEQKRYEGCVGYELWQGDSSVFLFSERKFCEIVGADDAQRLKAQLAREGLLSVAKAGTQGIRYVVKSPVGCIDGKNF